MCNETTKERIVTFHKWKWGRMGWGGGVGIIVMLLAACQSSSVAEKKKAKAEQPAAVVELPPPAPVATMPLLPPPPPPAPTALDLKLDSQAAAYTSDKAQVGTLFYAIGKAYKVNINVEQGIPDTYQEHFNGGTLRELIQGIVNANDLYTEQVDGTLYVKKTKVAFYSVDFPNIKRESSSETSVSLDPPVNNGTTTNNNVGGVLGAQTTTQTNQAGNQSNGGGGTTSFEVTEKSGDGPWAALKDEIQTQAVAGEKISINPSIGRIMVSSTVQRQELWKQYFDDWNQRMNYQVAVEITLHELQLNDAFSLGVDWTQVQTAISAGGGTSASFSTNTAFSSISGTALPASTLLGNFSTGKIAAAVKALQEQGTMKLVTNGSIRLLNNQKGFIKVGDDKTFFSLSQTTSLSTTGTASGIGTGTINTYSQLRQTIGFVTPVTVHVGSDRRITIDLEPARTQLNGTDTSPDGTQTAPDVNSSSLGTIIRLKDGESTMIGGLVQTLRSGQTNSLPFLGNIPLLGDLAKTDATNNTRTELLITVSAHIIP